MEKKVNKNRQQPWKGEETVTDKKGNYKWVILLIIILCGLNNVYFQYQMSPVADRIMAQYGLTQMQYSSLFTAPMAPAVFISLICGMIVDRFGAKRAISIALIVATLGIWGRLFATGYPMFYFCMLIPGFACTFINANNVKILGEWFDVKAISICVGLYLASSAIGQAIATSTTAMLPSVRAAYIIAGLYATFVTLVWVLFYRSGPSAPDRREQAPGSVFSGLGMVLKNQDVLIAGLGIMCAFGALMNMTIFMPMILQSRGLESVAAGTTASLISIGQLTGCLIGPSIVSKLGGARGVLRGLSVSGAALIAAIAFLPAGKLLPAALFLAGFVLGSMMPIFMSLPVKLQGIGVEKAGTAGGVLSTFQLLGAVLIPSYIISPLSGGSWTLLLLIGAVFCGAVCLLSFFLTGEADA